MQSDNFDKAVLALAEVLLSVLGSLFSALMGLTSGDLAEDDRLTEDGFFGSFGDLFNSNSVHSGFESYDHHGGMMSGGMVDDRPV